MDYLILAISAISLIVSVVVLIKLLSAKSGDGVSAKQAISSSIKDFGELISSNIEKTNKAYLESVEADLKRLSEQMALFRSELKAITEEENTKNISNIKERFEEFSKNMSEKFALISKSVDDSLGTLRRENSEKLDAIQKTVDEKLQRTLEGRLKSTFDSVIEQMGNVNKAVGEIKGLASDVGSLKNTLTNVKTKGIVGEVILSNIISEILTKEQYDENIATRKNSSERVEFAIKVPSGENGGFVYMPIDSKFPLEAYNAIKDCAEKGDKEGVEAARKLLRANIKKFAKDIKTKYIEEPYTTDFAIMFLPIEGLYIEAIESGLFEEVQREFKINIAGPSTLTALLNALQMSFKSFIIQKRSSEVFSLLKEIEKEFSKFAQVLALTQQKLDGVGDELEKLVGTRTRAIQREFKKLAELPTDSTEGDI